ncbi:hypothetical protein GUITHDRAFT_112521 [Guillardia theta CCMP2712]|uniref:Uncharacterized protein n=1 Tax=Guillardia theta (strain CCMP2712) TaxID=905079 RepID=L1IZS6_GUITC|nr:hypothetical protein GUITHDRAFT_112521 [Guillardia theta CCMP2712]EKX41310.1 hypothetical protein GUITHDRAFT_112521 [Guillardia theta CCMP2712]|eukprot:XP_005828290.1 hypothetical protein GUITHDRAFT_112521 [Guillardia theta CCMP2712]
MVAFQTFYRSQLCDDFLCAALDYFAALLKTLERKDIRERSDDESFVVTTEEEKASSILDQTMREVSTYYCFIIMHYSKSQAAQQDRKFFETLYAFVSNIVCAAFPFQHSSTIEDELGRIFRTETFNLTRRKNDANHPTKQFYTAKELFVLKNSGAGLSGKKLTNSLHARRQINASVNVAMKQRSALTAKLLPTTHSILEQMNQNLIISAEHCEIPQL